MNIFAITAAVAAQFIIGALWYSVVFGNLWGKMHGFDKLSKKQQQAMQASMGPWYGLQLVVTVMTTVALAYLFQNAPGMNAYLVTFLVWAGGIVPAQVSAAVFGGAPQGWVWHKILIQASGSLVAVMAATYILLVVK